MRRNWLRLLVGALAGTEAGLTGTGGGAVLVPLMVGVLRTPQHKAHGTSLVLVVPVALLSAVVYGLRGATDLVLVLELALGSMVGAVLGAQAMARVPARELRRGFGLFLLFLAVLLFLR